MLVVHQVTPGQTPPPSIDPGSPGGTAASNSCVTRRVLTDIVCVIYIQVWVVIASEYTPMALWINYTNMLSSNKTSSVMNSI